MLREHESLFNREMSLAIKGAIEGGGEVPSAFQRMVIPEPDLLRIVG
jgi:hypothetical protein